MFRSKSLVAFFTTKTKKCMLQNGYLLIFFQSTVDQDKRHNIRRQLRPCLPQQQQRRTFEVTRLLKSLQLSQQHPSVHREQHGQGSAWSSISVSVVPIELPGWWWLTVSSTYILNRRFSSWRSWCHSYVEDNRVLATGISSTIRLVWRSVQL